MKPHEDNGMSVEGLLVAERPEPRPEFAAELDARAAEGFARRRNRVRFRLTPALAGATAVTLVAAAVGVSGVLDRESEPIENPAPTPSATSREPDAAEERLGEAAEGDVAQSLESAPAHGVEPNQRKVARSADLTLSTAPAGVRDVADGVVDVTHRYRGFVASSNVSSGGGEAAGGDFELKIPARNLQPALDDLSELAHVSSLTEGSDDITRRFVTSRERLAELVEKRDRLRAKLDAAGTPEEEQSLRLRLREVRAALESVRGDLAAAAERVRFVPVHVGIEADSGAAPPDAGWSVGDAFDDAVRVLEVAVGVTLIALAAALPVAIVATLLWLAARAWVRRRRETALDEGPQPS